MSISPVSTASTDAITSAAANYAKQVVASNSGSSSALQESSESPSVTAQEAAKGDPVAKRLLAKEQQAAQLLNPTPAATEPGKGNEVDQKA